MFNVLNNFDIVLSNVQISHQEALYVFEDNEAVIKMVQREAVTCFQDPQSCA